MKPNIPAATTVARYFPNLNTQKPFNTSGPKAYVLEQLGVLKPNTFTGPRMAYAKNKNLQERLKTVRKRKNLKSPIINKLEAQYGSVFRLKLAQHLSRNLKPDFLTDDEWEILK